MSTATVDDTPATRLERLRTRVAAFSDTPYAVAALAIVSVIDGSVFPIPPFALLIPMVLARPTRAWFYAMVGTVASLFGGAIGYALGGALKAGVMNAFSIDPNIPVRFFGLDTTLAQLLTDNFWFLALAASISPLPYKVIAIGSGFVGVGIPAFATASIIGRFARFFLVAAALVLFETRAEKFLRR